MARVGQMAWRRGAAVTGAAVVVLSGLLLADGLTERTRAGAENERIERLESEVLTEAGAAAQLAEERELQTARSLARRERNQRLGWALLVASALFLITAQRAQGAEVAPPRPGAANVLVQLAVGSASALAAPAAGRVLEAEKLDLAVVDNIVACEGSGREAVIPILQAVQHHYRYLPEAALARICALTGLGPAEVVGVASFYAQFRRSPVGAHLVRICHGTACHVAGIEPITDELRRQLAIPPRADTDPARRFTLEAVNCLGCCSLAPVMMIDAEVAGHLTPTSACQALAAVEAAR